MKQMNKKRQQCILHFDRKKMWKIQWKYEMECFVHWLIRGKRHFKSYALSSESPGTDNIFIKFEATTFYCCCCCCFFLLWKEIEREEEEEKITHQMTKWSALCHAIAFCRPPAKSYVIAQARAYILCDVQQRKRLCSHW